MREIKYRLISKNKIVGYERVINSNWEWMWLELNPDNGVRWCNGVVEGVEGLIRNEYTGLKDKNGKEIYEGDIIRLTTEKDRVFGADSYCCQIDFIGNGWYYKTKAGLVNAANNRFNQAEVIGNIYETPELLK